MSHPQRPSRSRAENASQSSPLKGIRLRVTFTGPGSGDLRRLAPGKGFKVEGKGADITLVISATTPEEALAQLSVLSGLLASKT